MQWVYYSAIFRTYLCLDIYAPKGFLPFVKGCSLVAESLCFKNFLARKRFLDFEMYNPDYSSIFTKVYLGQIYMLQSQ